jgi:UDP-N-acetylglucosamine--N-acetylmuramyl-(pentapeptide) pyrophosphoryl-undecaprenol N-acetylglucosamine transferase
MNVTIAGGGTAGHVNPAIALARSLEGDHITFIGTKDGVEARLVAETGFPFETIDVRGFDRARPWSLATTAVRAAGAVGQARRIIRDGEADVVVGMGGYVSLPACLAARRERVPVVLHEQNIVFGLAHRVSKPFASKVAVSFQETLKAAGDKGVFTGNPVSPRFVGLDREAARSRARADLGLSSSRRTLLVFGGSLGARTINDAASGLAALWGERDDLQVLHITGRADHERVEAAVTSVEHGDLLYRVLPYTNDMGAAYAIADLALCRGGATTVAELCVLGVPSLLVPYPHHRDHQQLRHGRVLEAAGAAVVLADDEATPVVVADLAARLLFDEARLDEMRRAARGLAIPDAAERLARVVRGAGS